MPKNKKSKAKKSIPKDQKPSPLVRQPPQAGGIPREPRNSGESIDSKPSSSLLALFSSQGNMSDD